MRILDDELVLSPSDLTGFAACAHLTQLELSATRGEVIRPDRKDPLLDVLSRLGTEHEDAILASERDTAGRTVVSISTETRTRVDLNRRAAETAAAMEAGADVIYQGVFFDGRWAGYADFLERVPRPSQLGDWSYEVADAKLARSVKASAVLQLSAYTEWVAGIQGVQPEQCHVLTGDGERHSLRVRDFAAYYRRLKAEFEARVLGPGGIAADPTATYPEPVEHCSICRWSETCASRRRADDHLSLVAGMRRQPRGQLVDAGITTRRSLAKKSAGDRPPGMTAATFETLRLQCALQVKGQGCTPPLYELLPVVRPVERPVERPADDTVDDAVDQAEPARPVGLAALPEPSAGDLFLDLEGDPYVDGGLEYLFGVVEVVNGVPAYRAFWGHDRAGEKAAFEGVIDLITERRAQHPGMHVYHYAPYEPTAMRRLMGAHGTREAEVDALLRGEVFVDLYRVVRHAVRLSTESYSLKQVEKLYLKRPEGAVMDAGSSIVAYEQWLGERRQEQLDEIEAYNKDDCDSTLGLRDWFEARRSEVEAEDGPIPRPTAPARDTVELEEQLAETDALTVALTAGIPTEPEPRAADEQGRWLLAQLLSWHRREEKPAWWRFFDRCSPDRTDDDMIDDPECIGGLVYDGVVDQIKQSLVHRYEFVPQDHKFGIDSAPIDPVTEKGAGTIVGIGDDYVLLKRGANNAAPHPRSLIPSKPIITSTHKDSLLEVGTWVRDHGIDAPGPHRAARDLLLRHAPRIRTANVGHLASVGETQLDAACRIVTELDGGCLAIQGPPGTGKTFTGTHMILALLRDGKRVGITAQSHAVISNLLRAVLVEADKAGVDVPAIQKADGDNHCGDERVGHADGNAAVLDGLEHDGVLLAAGTSWLWCDPVMRESVDVLFVDEAGQRSLADVVATSVAATNLVLLGDPQQLAQVSQGSHPEGAERSALAHLLGDHNTMPAHLGLFLPTTYRMHPSVCAFISETIYEDKLESRPGLEHQVVGVTGLLGGAGLRFVTVEHEHNATSSSEEAGVVARIVGGAIGATWTDENKKKRKLGAEDVLVVAPYNAQVAELRRHLPVGARVGTVDKFQGQEAPITIFSMASSTADDAPRGMDFLYDLHRLNVAVSRARSISVVVCSPELLRVLCGTPKQMRLANALCRYAEVATEG